MRKEYNKGGLPVMSDSHRQKYRITLRFDTEHHLKLNSLVRESGQCLAEVIRQLIANG